MVIDFFRELMDFVLDKTKTASFEAVSATVSE